MDYKKHYDLLMTKAIGRWVVGPNAGRVFEEDIRANMSKGAINQSPALNLKCLVESSETRKTIKGFKILPIT